MRFKHISHQESGVGTRLEMYVILLNRKQEVKPPCQLSGSAVSQPVMVNKLKMMVTGRGRGLLSY